MAMKMRRPTVSITYLSLRSLVIGFAVLSLALLVAIWAAPSALALPDSYEDAGQIVHPSGATTVLFLVFLFNLIEIICATSNRRRSKYATVQTGTRLQWVMGTIIATDVISICLIWGFIISNAIFTFYHEQYPIYIAVDCVSLVGSFLQIAAMIFVCVEEDIRRDLHIQAQVHRLMNSPNPPNQYKPSNRVIKVHGYLRILALLLLVVSFGLLFPPFAEYSNSFLGYPVWQLVDVLLAIPWNGYLVYVSMTFSPLRSTYNIRLSRIIITDIILILLMWGAGVMFEIINWWSIAKITALDTILIAASMAQLAAMCLVCQEARIRRDLGRARKAWRRSTARLVPQEVEAPPAYVP